MQGLTFDGSLSFRMDLPMPKVGPGEALVRVRMAGICRTDLEIVKGYMGFRGVLGHEFVGEVVESPDSSRAGPGERVVGEINAACADCDRCREGSPRHCANRTVLGILGRDGAFAEYLTLPLENLHRVPPEVADEEAVFVEPLAAAYRILEQMSIVEETRVAVLGDGRLGHLVAHALRAAGANVTLVGRHPDRLEAIAKHGVETAGPDDLGDERFPLTVECTGNPSGFALATRHTEPRGTLVLKSTYAGSPPLDLAPVVIDEIRVVGSRCGPFRPALDALAARSVPVRDLVDGVRPLSGGQAAFEEAGKGLKILLVPGA